jgi:hypothetical protein
MRSRWLSRYRIASWDGTPLVGASPPFAGTPQLQDDLGRCGLAIEQRHAPALHHRRCSVLAMDDSRRLAELLQDVPEVDEQVYRHAEDILVEASFEKLPQVMRAVGERGDAQVGALLEDRRGHKYLSVVANHATGDPAWNGEGHSGDTVGKFFDELGPRAQREGRVRHDGHERRVHRRGPRAGAAGRDRI